MRIAAAMLALTLLAACGGGDDATAAPSLADELGCTSMEEAETEELFVKELHKCHREDGETTNVYVFDSSDARDSWREIAEEFGTVVVSEGDTYLETK